MSGIPGADFAAAQALSTRDLACWGGTLFTPTAGQFAHVMLWNPTASKLLLLRRLHYSGTTAVMGVQLRRVTAAGTNTGAATSKRLTGAAAAVGQIHTITNAAQQGTLFDSSPILATSGVVPMEFPEPIIIPPNVGFALVGAAVTNNLGAHFQWVEVDG